MESYPNLYYELTAGQRIFVIVEGWNDNYPAYSLFVALASELPESGMGESCDDEYLLCEGFLLCNRHCSSGDGHVCYSACDNLSWDCSQLCFSIADRCESECGGDAACLSECEYQLVICIHDECGAQVESCTDRCRTDYCFRPCVITCLEDGGDGTVCIENCGTACE